MSRYLWNKAKVAFLFFIIVIICIFALRIINLDQDIAPWGISVYQPADEGPYAYLAINDKVYGSINPQIENNGEQIPLMISENFITNLPGNLLNILSFHIFGNNYYGLRVPYIIFGAINIIIFSFLLNTLRNRYGYGKKNEIIAQMALILWIVLDFSMFNASRIVEPTIVRLIFVQLVALIYIKYPDSIRGRFFTLGILITFSTFFVYITNVFLYLAIMALIVISGIREGKKAFLKPFLWFIMGSISMFVVVEFYYVFVWHTEAIINAIRTIFSFSSNSSAQLIIHSEHSIIKTIALLYAQIVSSNPFIYNMPLLFAGTVAIIPLFRFIRKEKDNGILFLALIVFSFLLQTMVSTDTISRKMIVIFPIFVSVLFVLFIKQETIVFSMQEIDEITEDQVKKKTRKKKILFIIFWFFGIMNIMAAYIYRTKLYDWTYADYDIRSRLILLVLEVLPLIIIFVLGLFYFLIDDTNNKQQIQIWKKITRCLFISMCLCNVLFCVKYYWKKPAFTERDAMIKLADQVQDKYVLGGGFQLGWTLYNELKPIVNTPEKIMEIASQMDEPIFLDYTNSDNSLDSYFQDTFYSKSKEYLFFIPYYEIERGYQTFGYAHNMCLYKVQGAKEYREYLLKREEKAINQHKNAYAYLYNNISNNSAEANKIKQEELMSIWSDYGKRRYPLILNKDYPSMESKVYSIIGDIIDVDVPIYGDVMGDICGNINAPIYGNIYGNIFGEVNATITGNVYGNIWGAVNCDLNGDVYGYSSDGSGQGSILGEKYAEFSSTDCANKEKLPYKRTNEARYSDAPIYGDVNAHIVGDVDYPIVGNVGYNVYGNINNNIYGDIEGNVYGDVNAIVYGQIKGIVYGKINKGVGKIVGDTGN